MGQSIQFIFKLKLPIMVIRAHEHFYKDLQRRIREEQFNFFATICLLL